MFRIITNLLFGEEEKTIEDITSLEEEDEDWHLVSHQDAVAEEHQKVALLEYPPNSAVLGSSISQDADTSAISSESQDQNKKMQALPGVLRVPHTVSHSPSACTQRARAWAHRQSCSRKAVRRQNRSRLSVHHQGFHLHQPGHRNLCH